MNEGAGGDGGAMDDERLQRILKDLQAIAVKWNLELVYTRQVNGVITVTVGAVFTPRAESPAPTPGAADARPGES